ncbi:hypothetical protein, partial [uncultured Duncaniella sp.]
PVPHPSPQEDKSLLSNKNYPETIFFYAYAVIDSQIKCNHHSVRAIIYMSSSSPNKYAIGLSRFFIG